MSVPHHRMGTVIAGLLVAAGLMSLAACSGPESMRAALEQPPGQPRCITEEGPLPWSPPPTPPITTTFGPQRIPLNATTRSGGTEIVEHEAILDFAVAPDVARDHAIVVLTYTVHAGDRDWSPSRSLALVAYRRSSGFTPTGGVTLIRALCPVNVAAITAAMVAAERPPLPDPVPAGQTKTGSVAIAVPRGVTALTLREQVTYEGGAAWSDLPLYSRDTIPPAQPFPPHEQNAPAPAR